MKQMIAMLLALAMVLSLAACGQKTEQKNAASDESIPAEESLAIPADGAWERSASPEVTGEVKTLLDKALSNLDGASYLPVAYLGSQVVAGTNHALLCRVAPVVPDAVETYCVVYLYEDLEGAVTITRVDDSLAAANLVTDGNPDGWEQPESPELTEEARSALEHALEGFTGAVYQPTALVSTQTQDGAGTNYCILCECTITVPDAETGYVLVYVHEDPEGDAELTQIVDFEGTTQLTPSESEENVGLANPFVDYDSLDQAEEAAGFSMTAPNRAEGFSEVVYQVMDGHMIQIMFLNGDKRLIIRKDVGTEDISGDYTDYSQVQTVSVGAHNVTMKGDKGTVSLAIWDEAGYSYAVTADEPMEVETMTALVEQVS